MNIRQERAEFETWWDGLPQSMKSLLTYEVAKQAYELGRAALQSQDREDDPLQPAANWLIQAIESCTVADIQGRLSIGHNRAQRLFDHARRNEGDGNG